MNFVAYLTKIVSSKLKLKSRTSGIQSHKSVLPNFIYAFQVSDFIVM